MSIDTVRATEPGTGSIVGPTDSSLHTIRQDLLSPWPKIRLGTVGILVFLAAFFMWGVNGTDARPGELVAGIPNILDFIRRLFPPVIDMITITAATQPFSIFGLNVPALGFPQLQIPFPDVMLAIIETVQMAVIGTLLGVILAAPFGLLAARNTTPHPLVYQSTRMLLNANRALPEIVFALIFVAAVGLGPFSGVLTLAIGSVGTMGKLYAESIESIDPQQVLAVRATGAMPILTFIYSVIPQALPVIASYTLLLFESNIRAASILGIVGAGGVGFVISKYLALFQYQKLMGAMILLILTVTIIDRVSDRLRKRII